MAIERTLSIIKPDAVAKNVIGQIYARFEAAGLKVVAAKLAHLSRGEAEVIKVDESIIRSTDQKARGWMWQGKRLFVSIALRLPQISIIAAISSKGKIFHPSSEKHQGKL